MFLEKIFNVREHTLLAIFILFNCLRYVFSNIVGSSLTSLTSLFKYQEFWRTSNYQANIKEAESSDVRHECMKFKQYHAYFDHQIFKQKLNLENLTRNMTKNFFIDLTKCISRRNDNFRCIIKVLTQTRYFLINHIARNRLKPRGKQIGNRLKPRIVIDLLILQIINLYK